MKLSIAALIIATCLCVTNARPALPDQGTAESGLGQSKLHFAEPKHESDTLQEENKEEPGFAHFGENLPAGPATAESKRDSLTVSPSQEYLAPAPESEPAEQVEVQTVADELETICVSLLCTATADRYGGRGVIFNVQGSDNAENIAESASIDGHEIVTDRASVNDQEEVADRAKVNVQEEIAEPAAISGEGDNAESVGADFEGSAETGFNADNYALLTKFIGTLNKGSFVMGIPESRFGEIYEKFLLPYNEAQAASEQRKLQLHHAAEGSGVFTYVAWVGKGESKVPPYMTGVRGATALMYQRDSAGKISVLLVAENGNWKGISGTVDMEELPIDAAVREAKEEAGVVIDEDTVSKAKLIGKYSLVRDSGVADEHSFIAFQINEQVEASPTDGELEEVKWFYVDDILAMEPDANGKRSYLLKGTDKKYSFRPFLLDMLKLLQDGKEGFSWRQVKDKKQHEYLPL